MQDGGTEPHVLIVGAGTVGLLVAQALQKSGIKASVFEAEPSASYYRAREWGTSIQWALPLIYRLLPDELSAKLQSTAVDPNVESPDHGDSMPAYNAQTGKVLKQVPLPRFVRVSRHKFRALCAEGINVHYNKRLTSASATSSGVTLAFADGSSATGSLLIGADGARSHTRSCIYGAEQGNATPMSFKAVNMHVCYSDAKVSTLLRSSFVGNKLLALAFHPKGYWLWTSIQEAADESRPETWVFQLQWTWANNNHTSISSSPLAAKVQLDELRAVAERDFAEPWRTAWTAIPTGTAVHENNISTWLPIPIPHESPLRGKACLVGDAAHAMSFHRGQGLNHGIADAAKIATELKQVFAGGKSLEHALEAYETEMATRAGEEVRIGRMNTEMVHDWDKLMDSPFMKMGGAKSS